MLRLSRKDAGGPRLPQAASVLWPASEGQPGQGRSSDAIRKGQTIGSYLLAGAVGLVLGMGLGRAFVYPAPEPPTAMYKRSGAFVRACEAAGAEIASLRRATFFIDSCSAPIVTPLFGYEGQVIVSRTVEGHADDDDGGRVTYSVKRRGVRSKSGGHSARLRSTHPCCRPGDPQCRRRRSAELRLHHRNASRRRSLLRRFPTVSLLQREAITSGLLPRLVLPAPRHGHRAACGTRHGR